MAANPAGQLQALNDFALLYLYLELDGQRKNFEEMFEILYKRNNIK